MDFSEKQTIVCYIDKVKALFYQDIDGSMLQMNFPPDVITDQELTSREKLENLIEQFLETNKFVKGNIIFIYAQDIIIEKDFPDELPGNMNDEIQKFIDMVPFEEVLSKIYKLNKKTKVVAINHEIYNSIRNIFTKGNFLVIGVIPSTVLQETFSELSTNIDLAFIASKIYSLKQYSMINDEQLNKLSIKEKPSIKKEENIRLRIMIIVFAILLFILLVLIMIKLFPNNPAKNLPVAKPPLSPTQTAPAVNQPSIPIIQPSISTPSGSEYKLQR